MSAMSALGKPDLVSRAGAIWLLVLCQCLAVAAMAPARAWSVPEPVATWLSLKRTPGPDGGLAGLIAAIRALPPIPGRGVLAARATDVGHWQFANRDGERFTAADAAEIAHAIKTLAPEADGDANRLAFYLDADTVFRQRQHFEALPRGAQLWLHHGGPNLRILREGKGSHTRLYIETGSRMLVEATDPKGFREVQWQLARPLDRSALRTLALEPGGPTGIPKAPQVDPAARRAIPDPIDPGQLRSGLGGLRGQTAIASGRLEGERLAYKPTSGAEASIAVAMLETAARESDVNLIIIGSSSARQPGTRNWLWQRMEFSNVDEAVSRATLGDFLVALAGGNRLMVACDGGIGVQTRLRISPARGSNPGATGPLDSLTEVVSGTWSDILSETAGSLAVSAVRATLVSRDRQAELDRRILPGLPSWLQLAAGLAFVAGLLSLRRLLDWWQRIWPPENRAEYGAWSGYILAGLVRWIVFGGVFLPLAGIPAMLANLVRSASATLRQRQTTGRA